MENSKLSRNEMKKVLGGALSGTTGQVNGVEEVTCSTTCPDGKPISITCSSGACVAINGKSVSCGGEKKECASSSNLMVQSASDMTLQRAVLTQASVSMLAQANTAPQSMLMLLN